jgi:hypothetical protein
MWLAVRARAPAPAAAPAALRAPHTASASTSVAQKSTGQQVPAWGITSSTKCETADAEAAKVFEKRWRA